MVACSLENCAKDRDGGTNFLLPSSVYKCHFSLAGYRLFLTLGGVELSAKQYNFEDWAPIIEEVSSGVCDLFSGHCIFTLPQNKPAASRTGMAALPHWHQTTPGIEGVALQQDQSNSRAISAYFLIISIAKGPVLFDDSCHFY